jgi:transcriptional regulator with XRE-family HTH domain
MIKNQKQAGITRNKLAELNEAKRELEFRKAKYEPIEYELAENSINGMIEDLENQIKTYETLVNGNFHCLKPKNIEDIPNILIAARLSQQMSQKELADILGIKEQQVQRYEASDFEGTSWERIVEFASALKLQLFFEKIVIINTEETEEEFALPTGYSPEAIWFAEEKIKRQHSLIIE